MGSSLDGHKLIMKISLLDTRPCHHRYFADLYPVRWQVKKITQRPLSTSSEVISLAFGLGLKLVCDECNPLLRSPLGCTNVVLISSRDAQTAMNLVYLIAEIDKKKLESQH